MSPTLQPAEPPRRPSSIQLACEVAGAVVILFLLYCCLVGLGVVVGVVQP